MYIVLHSRRNEFKKLNDFFRCCLLCSGWISIETCIYAVHSSTEWNFKTKWEFTTDKSSNSRYNKPTKYGTRLSCRFMFKPWEFVFSRLTWIISTKTILGTWNCADLICLIPRFDLSRTKSPYPLSWHFFFLHFCLLLFLSLS